MKATSVRLQVALESTVGLSGLDLVQKFHFPIFMFTWQDFIKTNFQMEMEKELRPASPLLTN